MRTNIDIDDALMERALQVTGLTSKRAAVNAGLKLLLEVHDQQDILELAGKVHWEGDLDAWREGRTFNGENDLPE
jgi:Arc/MetJ family transcription regulator